MPKVVLLTGHYYNSKRKAGFHWLANAYHSMGWEVLFFTTTISWLSYIRKDYRMEYPIQKECNKLIKVKENYYSYIWWTLWHPANLRIDLLNKLSIPLFNRYSDFPFIAAEEFIKSADLIIFESTPGIMLFGRFKNINSSARYVYRVSDDMKNILKVHPAVVDKEESCCPAFDLISTPSKYIYDRFSSYTTSALNYHGVHKKIFLNKGENPYKQGTINAIFVGNSHFDHWFLESASRQFPNILFHIIGPIDSTVNRDNIIYYGEIPFSETVPYIIHSHIGLCTVKYTAGAESFTDSLKIIQYTYNKLAIVAPRFLESSRTNMVYYRPGDEKSVKEALVSAMQFERETINTDNIYDWNELALLIAGDL